MAIFDQFPYTNFHELNLDWMIKAVKEVKDNIDTTAENAAIATEQANIAKEQADLSKYYAENITLYFETPEQYGAVGDGVTDDTQAFKDLFATGNKQVKCSPGKNYMLSDVISLKNNTHIDLNGASLTTTFRHLFYNFDVDDVFTGYAGNGNISIKNGILNHGGISFIHAENILLENIQFKNCINDHIVEICACINYVITNCHFEGMATRPGTLEYINIDPCYSANFPWLNDPNNYDGTPNKNLIIINNVLKPGAAPYNYGDDAIGVHDGGDPNAVNHSNIFISGNIIEGFNQYAMRINCMDDAVVSSNLIKFASSYAMETGAFSICNDVAITNNTFINTTSAGSQKCYVLFRPYGHRRLRLCDNNYGSLAPTITYNKFYLNGDANTVFTTVKFDKEVSASATQPNLPLTAFNRMDIQVGAPGNSNYQTVTIGSFYNRGFAVGETYRYVFIQSDGTTSVESVTITNAHTLTSTQSIKNLILYTDDILNNY